MAKKIFAVVVAVGGAYNHMDMLSVRHTGRINVSRAYWPLMIELDEYDRAVDAEVVGALVVGAADPGKVGPIEVLSNLFESNLWIPPLNIKFDDSLYL